MSGIVNKIKEAVHSDSKTHGSSAPEGTHGPHGSRVGNAADPRVDSDLDNRGAGRTAGQGEYGSSGITGAGRTAGGEYGSSTTGTGAGGLGRTAGHGEYGSSGVSEGTHGPHGSRVANAADPRVDSDLDNSRTFGTGASSGARGTGSYGTGTTGTTGGYTAGETGSYGTGNTGRYGTGGAGESGAYGATGAAGAGGISSGVTGTHGAPTGTHGPHSSRVGNAADPRVDSDRDGRGAYAGSGPGPASDTAGPHKSDLANKVDPRVDSDLDNSRTVGGNKTYQEGVNRDPTDAAQVPPSVLKKHVGDPSIEHTDAGHHRERRHSIKTHQENFRGL